MAGARFASELPVPMSGGQGSRRASVSRSGRRGRRRDEPHARRETVKLIPAVFFQKTLSGAETAAKTPERLELFESELRAVVGGALRAGGAFRAMATGGPD